MQIDSKHRPSSSVGKWCGICSDSGGGGRNDGVGGRGGGGSGRLFILELSYFSLPTTPTQKPTEFA